MILNTRGNILQCRAEAVVNTVNCVGVMGRGLAAQCKRAYPANFRAYQAACNRRDVVPGRMFVFETGHLDNPRFIVNFPTKRHWREPSRLEDIQTGLVALIEEVRQRDIKSIAIPALGCGLGGLDWKEVKPLVERAFWTHCHEVLAYVFEPLLIGRTQ